MVIRVQGHCAVLQQRGNQTLKLTFQETFQLKYILQVSMVNFLKVRTLFSNSSKKKWVIRAGHGRIQKVFLLIFLV